MACLTVFAHAFCHTPVKNLLKRPAYESLRTTKSNNKCHKGVILNSSSKNNFLIVAFCRLGTEYGVCDIYKHEN